MFTIYIVLYSYIDGATSALSQVPIPEIRWSLYFQTRF